MHKTVSFKNIFDILILFKLILNLQFHETAQYLGFRIHKYLPFN